MIKTKTFEVKADHGTISGYASTWTREPDSYGDIVAKGAFAEHIAQIKEEGRVLPFLFNHKADDLRAYIGTVFELKEDDHGLYFEGTFDDTPEGQRARELALEDGRKANELRKLNIHEISLVMYPANTDTSVVSVKSGRRNSAKDADAIREAIALLQGVLGELDDTDEDPQESEAKSEEPDTANDEEQKRKADLLEHANKLLKEVNYDS